MDLLMNELGCDGAETVGCADGCLYWHANALIVMRRKKDIYSVSFPLLGLTDVHLKPVY